MVKNGCFRSLCSGLRALIFVILMKYMYVPFYFDNIYVVNAVPRRFLDLDLFLNFILLKNKGTLDKYIGDAIIAIFGSPIELKDHEYKGALAICRMNDKLEELDRYQAMSRLSRVIVPEAIALIVNNSSHQKLKNANLSHYQMVRQPWVGHLYHEHKTP